MIHDRLIRFLDVESRLPRLEIDKASRGHIARLANCSIGTLEECERRYIRSDIKIFDFAD